MFLPKMSLPVWNPARVGSTRIQEEEYVGLRYELVLGLGLAVVLTTAVILGLAGF